MAIKVVPRGTIRPENDPLHRVAMVAPRGLSDAPPTRTFEEQMYGRRLKDEEMGGEQFISELRRRQQQLDMSTIPDYIGEEATRRAQNKAFPNDPQALGKEEQDVRNNLRGLKQDIAFSPGEMVRLNALGREAAAREQASFKPALADKETRDKLNLTAQEAQMYGRHLGNLRGPGGVDHPDGSRSTLMNMGVQFGDRYYNIPRVYDGKILSRDEAIAKAQGLGLENFPSYKDQATAEARYKELHSFMEKDAKQLFRREAGGPLQEKNAFPIVGVDSPKSIVTSTYGDARRGGAHAGADMRVPIGTPLTAIDGGTVLRTFSEGGGDRGYGHGMDVIYKDGTVHRMAHLGTADRSVNPYGTFKVGDSFKAGDTLAYSGRSGIHQSAPHVHYEIFANKNMYDKANAAGNSHANVDLRVDPVKYFQGGRDQAVKESLKVQSQGREGGGLAGTPREVANTVATSLRAAGYTDNAIAGILRNAQHESSMDPSSITRNDQPNYRGTEAAHGHGLFSEGGAEFNNMQAWMQKNYPNGHWSDPKIQAEWIAARLKQGYPQLDATMRNPNTTREQAAQAFLNGYLKPAEQHRIRRNADYARGVPGIEHFTGPAAPAKTPEVKVAPTAPAAQAPAVPEAPVPGPLEDPSIAARQRDVDMRPAPGPEDPSIAARDRERRRPIQGIEDPSIAARRQEMQQTAPSVQAPAGTPLAPTMGEEDPSANPIEPSVRAAGEAAGSGPLPDLPMPGQTSPNLAGDRAAPAAPPAGIEDPRAVALARQAATAQQPGPEDPSIIARQREALQAQGSAPTSGADASGDFPISVQPGGIGSDYAASQGGGTGGGTGMGSGSSALDSWQLGQPIMPAILSDIFGIGGGGGGIFGGGGKAPAFKNLVQSYTPSPDTILPAAGPEQSVLPTSLPPPPPAPPPSPQGGGQAFLSQYMQRRRHA